MTRTKNRSLSYESLSLNGYPADQVDSRAVGRLGTLSHRMIFSRHGSDNGLMSPWHDILLFAPNGNLTCVCSTPAGTWLVNEPAMDEPYNPLRPLKTKETHVEFVDQHTSVPLPAHLEDNSLWNLGVLPQTWVTLNQRPGQFQPLEIIDIGAGKERHLGDVYVVKPLGACCMEDNGTIIWKIIGIGSDDSMAGVLNDMEDIETWLPGLLDIIQEWLKHLACIKSGLSAEEQLCTLVDLYLTRQKLFELHDSWRLHPARVSMHAANSLISLDSLSPSDFLSCWMPYLDRFREAEDEDSLEFEFCIPPSCPSSVSENLFDLEWLTEGGKGLSSFHSRIVEETDEAMEEAREDSSDGEGSVIEYTVEGNGEAEEEIKEVEDLHQEKVRSEVKIPICAEVEAKLVNEMDAPNCKQRRKKLSSLSRAKNSIMKLLHLRHQREGSREISVVMEPVQKGRNERGPRKEDKAEKAGLERAGKSEELLLPPKIQGLFSQSSLDSFGAKVESKRSTKSEIRQNEPTQLHSGEIMGGFGMGAGGKPVLPPSIPSRRRKPHGYQREEEKDFSKILAKGSSSSETSAESTSGPLVDVVAAAGTARGSGSFQDDEVRTRTKLSARYKLSSSGKVLLSTASGKVTHSLLHSNLPAFEERRLRRSMTCRESASQEDSVSIEGLI